MLALPDPSSFQAIGWIIVTLGAAALAINQTMTLIRQWRGEPSSEHLHMRVNELEKIAEDGVNRRRRIWEEFGVIRKEGEQKVLGVYVEFNKLREDVSGLKKDTDHHTRHLIHIEGKLDRVIERHFK